MSERWREHTDVDMFVLAIRAIEYRALEAAFQEVWQEVKKADADDESCSDDWRRGWDAARDRALEVLDGMTDVRRAP